MSNYSYIHRRGPAVIFVHGILGFAERNILGLKIRYFRRLAEELKDCGLPCYFPALPPVGTFPARSVALARYVAKLDHKRLFLIGHSMGGLDCRYFTQAFDTLHRVRAVVTLGTPPSGHPPG